jgi:hypothetical protein
LGVAAKTVLLCEIEPEDVQRVLAFTRALPEHDLLFLRRDITQSEEVATWIADVREGRYSSVAAIVGDALVGYAIVAKARTPIPCRRPPRNASSAS